MTENEDPLENPFATRINGILKDDYLRHYPIANQSQAMELLEDIVERYSKLHPHPKPQYDNARSSP